MKNSPDMVHYFLRDMVPLLEVFRHISSAQRGVLAIRHGFSHNIFLLFWQHFRPYRWTVDNTDCWLRGEYPVPRQMNGTVNISQLARCPSAPAPVPPRLWMVAASGLPHRTPSPSSQHPPSEVSAKGGKQIISTVAPPCGVEPSERRVPVPTILGRWRCDGTISHTSELRISKLNKVRFALLRTTRSFLSKAVV